MALEIERKFLVCNDDWRARAGEGVRYRQGYLCNSEQASVRVRIGDRQARLNIKSGGLVMERLEFEFPIGLDEAEQLLEQVCRKPLIEKTRFKIPQGRHCWEVDVFEGDNQGLVVAELELARADEPFERPAWLGEEVTDDTRYYNVCLIDHPYKQWR